MNPYTVHSVTFSTGERFHVLREKATGAPLFEATLFTVSVARAKGLASATIKQILTALMVFQLALDGLEIDIDERLSQGRLLDLDEVESVIALCRKEVKSIVRTTRTTRNLASPRLVNLEDVRMRSATKVANDVVDENTAGIRIRYIRDYLNWLAAKRELKIGPAHSQYAGLSSIRQLIKDAFTERVPAAFSKNSDDERQGLSKEALVRLREVTDPTSPENPWKGAATKVRNQLIVDWFLALGLRNGELLGIRTSHINFRSNDVTVTRQADEVLDPRAQQPNVKTRGRVIPMSEELVTRTQQYISKERRAQGVARKSDWLFVANGTGKPLSLTAVNKMFAELRAKCSGLPPDLSPHMLRHTWNDTFSDLMDERKVPEEQEKRMRNELMGWAPNSKTAATYTRRFVRRKAREASLALQNALKGPICDE